MTTNDFYTTLDSELCALIKKYESDPFIKKHHSAIDNQKGYALLIWFLDFYGKISHYADFITEHDDDNSCDIVFDNTDDLGVKTFCVVQSKWNNLVNASKEAKKDEILKALARFETILRGQKLNVPPKLQTKLEDLDKHLKANGAVKFIFLSLSQYNGGADVNIKAFKNDDTKIDFEVIDINRIKFDYIDRKYKGIKPTNPLRIRQTPEESEVILHVEKSNQNGGNYIKIERPFEAYTFLIRPKTIYELFEKYGFSIFYKNVRNPLLQSQFNEAIEKTALENSAYFWYYNNGITAITSLLPPIGKQAVTIKVVGLQIINGAQTVYAVYRAYKNASTEKRRQLDAQMFLSLRLLQSGGKEFDLNVTRFTNSQNPVDDRDFCANDEIQVALQNASYQTKFWYEKRRGEFRDVPKGVTIISNDFLATDYLAYQLQDPTSVINKNLIFISHKVHPEGLYEKIFNKYTSFEDMLAARYVASYIDKYVAMFLEQETFLPVLALSKIAFTKYLKAKFQKDINVNKYIIKLFEKNETEIVKKVFLYVMRFFVQYKEEHKANWLFTPSYYYDKIKEALEELAFNTDDIETIIYDDDDKDFVTT